MATIYFVSSLYDAGCRRGRNCATPRSIRRFAVPSVPLASRLAVSLYLTLELVWLARSANQKRDASTPRADSPSLSPERLACPQKAFSESVCLLRGVHLYIYCIYIITKKKLFYIYICINSLLYTCIRTIFWISRGVYFIQNQKDIWTSRRIIFLSLKPDYELCLFLELWVKKRHRVPIREPEVQLLLLF